MRDVAIIAFAQLPSVRRDVGRAPTAPEARGGGGAREARASGAPPPRSVGSEEVELVQPVVAAALAQAHLPREDVGFTVSGSCDYLLGRPFSFVMALDAVAPWPPIHESHVEMDGAWALWEAWVRLQAGDIDTALVYAYGKSSLGDLPEVLVQQLDPYVVAPLGADAVGLAALQARALIDAGRLTERDLAELAAARRRQAADNPCAQRRTPRTVDELLAEPYQVAPLRAHACPPISDGACAVVLAAGDTARRLVASPAWIRGIDHRIEPHQLGMRDLTASPSTRLAAERAGALDGRFDLAELHAPFAHQETILRDALGLAADVVVNPSGGALSANPMMVAGLARLGEAATRLMTGQGRRAVAHATSGPCLQQNLVCVLERDV